MACQADIATIRPRSAARRRQVELVTGKIRQHLLRPAIGADFGMELPE